MGKFCCNSERNTPCKNDTIFTGQSEEYLGNIIIPREGIWRAEFLSFITRREKWKQGLSSDFSDTQSGRIRTRTQDSCLKTRPHRSQLSMLVSLCHNSPTACLEGAAIALCQTQATNPALSREPDIVPLWMAHRPHYHITRNAPFPGAKVPRCMQK